MPNIFGEEDPETTEANNRAKDLLTRMINVLEELHSRFGDGFNSFGADETGVIRLLLIFDELMNSETYDGNGWAFVSTAVNTIEKKAPIVQKPLTEVLQRRVPSDLESCRLWIVYCLDTVDCFFHSLKAFWQLPEVLDAFYKRSSPIFATNIDFKKDFLKLVEKLHHPAGGGSGTMEFNLDIGALSAFNTIFRSQVLKQQQQSGNNNNNNNDSSKTKVQHESPRPEMVSPVVTQQHGGTTLNAASHGSNNDDRGLSQNYGSTVDLRGGGAAVGADGKKKVIRKVIKKKGTGEVVSTTIEPVYSSVTSGGKFHHDAAAGMQHQGSDENPAEQHSTSSYPVVASFVTSNHPTNTQQQQNHHHSHSPAPSQMQHQHVTAKPNSKESQTVVTSIIRADKYVQVTSSNETTSNNNNNNNKNASSSNQQQNNNNNSTNNNTNAAKRSFDELQELDLAFKEREKTLKQKEAAFSQSEDNLKKRERDLESKLEEVDYKLTNVTDVAAQLKRLYNELFNQSEGGQKKVNASEIDKMLPKLVAVLNGEDLTLQVVPSTSMTMANRAGSFSARRPTIPPALNNNNTNNTNSNNFTTIAINDTPGNSLARASLPPSGNSRPRAQTTLVSNSSMVAMTVAKPVMSFNSTTRSHTGGADDADDQQDADDNVNDEKQQNKQQTPDSSYNPSPFHSPAPRVDRSVSELSQNNNNLLQNSSFASASVANLAPKMPSNPNGIVTVAPDTCTTRPTQGIPYIIDMFEESERNVQIKKQNGRCAKCGIEVTRNEQSNPLLRSIVNMGQLALQQKPRRCHYSAELFCHKCHTNKTALVPHKICAEWDFEEYHVSDNWYDYLSANFDRPIIHLPDVPLVAKKPAAMQLAQFRRKLNRMHAVLVLCPAIQRQARSVFTTSYYFSREHWWSLSDFVRMRLLEQDSPSSLSRGVPNADLLQHLGRLMSEALDHINSCPSCREKGYGVCTLCHSGAAAAASSSSPNHHNPDGTMKLEDKVAFWEDGAACESCGSIFHESCLELKGCSKCKK